MRRRREETGDRDAAAAAVGVGVAYLGYKGLKALYKAGKKAGKKHEK